MSINRTDFFEPFAQSSPQLGCIFLNHTGAPAKLLTDTPTIELLVDKAATVNFINYCKSHPLVKELVIYPLYQRKKVLVEFQDGSELSFVLMKSMVRKSIVCEDFKTVRKNAFVNEFGVLVPSHEQHFTYHVLKCQFDKVPPSDRFQNYTSTYSGPLRSVIFKYLQTRFNPVFNILEDLFIPKPNMLLTIIIGLRGEKRNTLLRMLSRSIEQVLFNLFGSLTKKEIRIAASHDPLHAPEIPSSNQRTSTGQAML